MNKDLKISFEQMRAAGTLAAQALDEVTSYVKHGILTNKLDKICYEFIRDNGGYSAPLFYKGFPKSCCTSVNHVVCHGIPYNKYLSEGDIINIDVTAIVNGWHGDTSRMFFVGDVSVKSKNLVSTTYDSMMKAISIIKNGIHLGDVGEAIQTYVEKKGFQSYILYLIQREDCNFFKIAEDIDEKYKFAFNEAFKSGVKILCYDCKLCDEEIKLNNQIKLF